MIAALTVEQVQAAARLHAAGRSHRAIARALGVDVTFVWRAAARIQALAGFYRRTKARGKSRVEGGEKAGSGVASSIVDLASRRHFSTGPPPRSA